MKTFPNKTIIFSLIKDLRQLFFVFFKIGSITFGGGLAMLPILEDELSIKRKWTSRSELLDYFAIGQVTPGIIAVNTATFVGYKRRGILGGIIATLGLVTPAIIIISILASFLSNFAEIPQVKKALAGINIAVAALLTKVVWDFAKNSIRNIFHALLTFGSFAAISVLKVHTAWIVLVALAAGLTAHLIFLRKESKKQLLDRAAKKSDNEDAVR